jgi:hypothetical protein
MAAARPLHAVWDAVHVVTVKFSVAAIGRGTWQVKQYAVRFMVTAKFPRALTAGGAILRAGRAISSGNW